MGHADILPRWMRPLAVLALVFGILTVMSGGSVLFSEDARRAAGNYVPFVVWFNFLAGFGYVAAAVGLWFGRRWAAWLSVLIAGMTLLIFAALGLYILAGGAYEMRTLGAMTLRSAIWVAIAVASCRVLSCPTRHTRAG
jgi:hypothetical protein